MWESEEDFKRRNSCTAKQTIFKSGREERRERRKENRKINKTK